MFIKKLKKCLRFFNKEIPLYAGLSSKEKNFSNCQATYQKELYLLSEKSGNFFHKVNIEIALTPFSRVRFRLLFNNSPAPRPQPTL